MKKATLKLLQGIIFEEFCLNTQYSKKDDTSSERKMFHMKCKIINSLKRMKYHFDQNFVGQITYMQMN